MYYLKENYFFFVCGARLCSLSAFLDLLNASQIPHKHVTAEDHCFPIGYLLLKSNWVERLKKKKERNKRGGGEDIRGTHALDPDYNI